MHSTLTPWPYPFWIAHRGAGWLAPENTLAALATGIAHGLTMAEFDAKLSADGVAILLHDDDLLRTAGIDGLAKAMSAAELTQVDVSLGYPQYAGACIPTLADVAAFCQAKQMAVNIEIKPCAGREAETGRLVGAQAAKLWQNTSPPPLFSSFCTHALAELRATLPNSHRGLLIEGWDEDNATILAKLQQLGCVALHVPDAGTTQAHITYFQQAGYAVLVWTVNDGARAKQLMDWGVNGIITDKLALANNRQTTATQTKPT